MVAPPNPGVRVKLVTAVVKPHRLEAVKVALGEIGVYGMTVTEVKGHGRQRGHLETYRGAEYEVDLVPKVRVEVLCADERHEGVVDAIVGGARTGKIGDGKVWVLDLGSTTRIRTGEAGPEAV